MPNYKRKWKQTWYETAGIIGSECQWKFKLFYWRLFNKNGSRQQRSTPGERIKRAKGLGPGEKMNCSRVQFPAVWVKLCFEFDWTCQVTQLLLITVLACTQWKAVFKIGEHCQFMVNKTEDFKHCYLCHDCIVIFLNFEHVYNRIRWQIQVE